MHVLAGIEVVSLAVNVPGPVAAARIVEHGASVVKIEPPQGDPLHRHAPRWYARLTGSQTILRLDLKTREGQAALAQRLQGADLLLTAFPAIRRVRVKVTKAPFDMPNVGAVAVECWRDRR